MKKREDRRHRTAKVAQRRAEWFQRQREATARFFQQMSVEPQIVGRYRKWNGYSCQCAMCHIERYYDTALQRMKDLRRNVLVEEF